MLECAEIGGWILVDIWWWIVHLIILGDLILNLWIVVVIEVQKIVFIILEFQIIICIGILVLIIVIVILLKVLKTIKLIKLVTIILVVIIDNLLILFFKIFCNLLFLGIKQHLWPLKLLLLNQFLVLISTLARTSSPSSAQVRFRPCAPPKEPIRSFSILTIISLDQVKVASFASHPGVFDFDYKWFPIVIHAPLFVYLDRSRYFGHLHLFQRYFANSKHTFIRHFLVFSIHLAFLRFYDYRSSANFDTAL